MTLKRILRKSTRTALPLQTTRSQIQPPLARRRPTARCHCRFTPPYQPLSSLVNSHNSPRRPRRFAGAFNFTRALTLLSLLLAGSLGSRAGDAASVSGSVINTAEGQRFELQWTGQPGARYRVQERASLNNPDGWKTLDLVLATTNTAPVRWTAPEDLVQQRFYRLAGPDAAILSVEPAIAPPNVPVTLYVLGQCFQSNDVLRVGGAIPGGAIISAAVSSVSLAAQPPGWQRVELVRDGAVLSFFEVLFGDANTAPERVLQGPPELPPAAPVFRSRGIPKSKPAMATSSRHATKPRGGGDQDCDGFTGDVGGGTAWFRRCSGLKTDTEVYDYQEGGDNETVLRATGELRLRQTDLAIPGRGLDFIWARTYRSRTTPSTSFGTRWTHSYDVDIQPLGGDLVIHDGTGRADTFKPGTNGVYTCPEFFSEGTFSNSVFTLTFADTGRWEFNPLDASPAAGKLVRIVDRNGNTVSLGYDPTGRLTQIVDDLGRTNLVHYDPAGRVADVTDFSGRVVRYEYDLRGDLTACVSPAVTGTPNGNDFPGGKTNRYTYSSGYADERENHLLLSTMDAAGQTVNRFVYQHNESDFEFLRCTSWQHGSATPVRFTYLPLTAVPANQFATVRVLVNDAEGDVVEHFYDARNRCVKRREFTGRATPGLPVTDTVNRPAGKLRASDPDYFETQWTWNNDSLRTSVKVPGRVEYPNLVFVYQSDFDRATPARKRADLRVVREFADSPVDLDGDGVAETTERVWHYEYDPRFGTERLQFQPEGTKGRRIHAIHAGPPKGGLRAYDPQKHYLPGDTAVFSAGRGIKDFQTGEVCDPSNSDEDSVNLRFRPGGAMLAPVTFVTAATDPRGNVTTADYDPNGNCTVINPRAARDNHLQGAVDVLSVMRFAYNAHGQLTTITNAADANGYRRVDTFSYYDSGAQAGYLQSIAIDEPGVLITTTFEYDPRGNLTRCIDPRGNDWLFTCNSLDQCVRVQSPTNLTARCTTDYSYDANDNLVQISTEVRDASDNVTGSKVDRFQYDSLHRLTEVALAVNATQALTNRFIYDGNGRCLQALGGDAVSGADTFQKIAFEYDERGLLFRRIAAPGSPLQSTTQCDYDANGNLARVTEGLEGTPSVTTVEYDGLAGFPGPSAPPLPGVPMPSLARFRLPFPNDIRVNADGTLNAARQISLGIGVKAVGATYTVPQASFSRPSKITDPMGNVTTFSFDANDNLKAVRHFGETNDVPGSAGNLRLAETRCDYDRLNRLRRIHALHFGARTQSPIGDGEATTTFSYAPNNTCLSVTDDNHHTTRFRYDAAGRLSGVARGIIEAGPFEEGVQQCAFARDAGGNVTSFVQSDRSDLGGPPQVFALTNGFDPLNRCVSTTDNVGNNHRYAYDSLNRVTAQFNPREYTRTFAYDLLDRCTLAVTDLDGDGVSDLAHDYSERATWSTSNGRLLSTTDSHTNTTSYGYDSLGRCTNVTNADGTRHTFVWDSRNVLASEQDANGTLTLHTYDLNHRCTANQYAPGPSVAATTTFEQLAYDGLSRLVGAVNNASSLVMGYDSLGNPGPTIQDGLVIESNCDSLGNRLSLTYPGGQVVSYTYDSLNRCTGIHESGTALATFAYAGPGRLARITRANGVRTDVDWNGLVSPPNAPGDFGWQRVSRVSHTRVSDGFLVDEWIFQHDPNQNTRSRVRTPGTIVPGETIALTYDPADRLVNSMVTRGGTLAGSATYGLDRMGNRTNIKRPFCAGSYSLDAALPPGDFQMNRYTATPCDVRTYDANGNLTSAGPDPASPVSYTYDCLDRLVAVSNSGVPVATYAYDALGRRISKSVSIGGLPPVTTGFLYDGDDVIEERVGNGVLATVFHGLDGDDGTGPVLAMRRAGQDFYFHTDDLGNVLALTDAKGAVVERYDYDDYGRPQFLGADGLPLTGSDGQPVTASPLGNPFLFHSMRWDEELLFFYGHSERSELRWNNDPYAEDGLRYYDPQTGRGLNHAAGELGSGNNPWSGGGRRNRLSMNVTVPKQTQGAAFGERVNAGLHAAGGALAQGAARFRPAFFDVFADFAPTGLGASDFVNDDDALVNPAPVADTLAHELAHVIQQRAGSPQKTKHDTVKNSISNVR